MNMARAYFAAKNYPQASVYYNQVPRPSITGWMRSLKEDGLIFVGDMNGVLGLLHTSVPILWRRNPCWSGVTAIMAWSCSVFNEANNGIDHSQFDLVLNKNPGRVCHKSPEDLFDLVRSRSTDNRQSTTPYLVDTSKKTECWMPSKVCHLPKMRLQN